MVNGPEECDDGVNNDGRLGGCNPNCTLAVDCAGLTQCGTICTSTDVDSNHCGRCDNSCGDGLVCEAGRCEVSCSTGTRCSNMCVDVAMNPDHCGRCGNVCTPPDSNGQAACAGGFCTVKCDGGYSQCGSSCVDLTSNPSHCGKCGNSCDAPSGGQAFCQDSACGIECNQGLSDCDGQCVDKSTNVDHCGSCGRQCDDVRNGDVLCKNDECTFSCRNGLTCEGEPVPLCGVWTFESNTPENWQSLDPALYQRGQDVAVGDVFTTTSEFYEGQSSLGLGVEAVGAEDEAILLTQLFCAAGTDLQGKSITVALLAASAPGNSVTPGMIDAQLGVAEFASLVQEFTPFEISSGGSWSTHKVDVTTNKDAGSIALFVRFHAPWKGTIYVDSISIE